jgi:hypothetical protein
MMSWYGKLNATDTQEAIAAMEVESRIRKKGQVIQHRHVSPPLPSSSQPIGSHAWVFLTVDSPTKRLLDRRGYSHQYNDIREIEAISSPPSRAQSPVNKDVTVLSIDEPQETFTTPPASKLGGSSFRRKPNVPTDISSPQKVSQNYIVESQDSVSFDSQETIPSVSLYNSQHSIPSPPRSTSPVIPARPSVRETVIARTSSGEPLTISRKPPWKKVLAAQKQKESSRAQKAEYYGVDIHRLLDRIDDEKLQSSLPRYSSPIRELM